MRAQNIILVAALFCFLSVTTAKAAEVFNIDAAHTLVGFEVTHMMINDVEGKFKDFSGQITWDGADLTKSSIVGTIKAASLSTDNDKRDEHLRSSDFFEIEK